MMILLQRPEVNWGEFLEVTKRALGYSVASQLDAENANKWDAASYLCALSEIWEPGLRTKEAQRKAGSLLQHLYLSVLTTGSRSLALELAEETDLATKSQFTVHDEFLLIVASGNLQQWRTSIINCSTGRESHSLRLFMNAALKIFEGEGLGELWAAFSKKDLPDTTQLLIPK